MDEVIRTSGLQKRLGVTRALDGLDLSVDAGEVHRVPRTQRCRQDHDPPTPARNAVPDGGGASLLGGDPWRDGGELHRRLAYVPGEVSLWPNLNGERRLDAPRPESLRLMSRAWASFRTRAFRPDQPAGSSRVAHPRWYRPAGQRRDPNKCTPHLYGRSRAMSPARGGDTHQPSE